MQDCENAAMARSESADISAGNGSPRRMHVLASAGSIMSPRSFHIREVQLS
jgi:hypothetical protein